MTDWSQGEGLVDERVISWGEVSDRIGTMPCYRVSGPSILAVPCSNRSCAVQGSNPVKAGLMRRIVSERDADLASPTSGVASHNFVSDGLNI